jgi:HK97 gp10 family phage protein
MPSSVTLDVSVLEKLGLAVDAGLEEALLAYGQAVIDDAKTRCPVSQDGSHGNPPGTLRDSLAATETGPLEVTLHDGVEYGQYVHEGARGRAGRPFLGAAIDAAEGRLPGVVASAVERVASASGGKGQPKEPPAP